MKGNNKQRMHNFATDFSNKNKVISISDNGESYAWNDTIYEYLTKYALRSRIILEARDFFDGNISSADVTDIFHQVKDLQVTERENLNSHSMIPVKNGYIDLEKLEFAPSDPQYLYTWNLDIDYDRTKDCPLTERLLRNVLDNDQIKVFYEFLGYCLMTGRTDIKESLFICYGPSNGGKSFLIDVIGTFLSDKNVSSESITALADERNRWSRGRLYGKMANVRSEVSNKFLSDLNSIKEIVSGDPISAERKGEDLFTFRSYAKFFFCCNDPPRLNHDDAFRTRLAVLPINKEIPESERLPKSVIMETISRPDELSGLLNKALEGMIRLRTNKRFSLVGRDELHAQYKVDSDPIGAFVEECIDYDDDGISVLISNDIIWSRFVDYISQKGVHNGVSYNGRGAFFKRIRSIIGEDKVGRNGNTKGYRGIRIQLPVSKDTPQCTPISIQDTPCTPFLPIGNNNKDSTLYYKEYREDGVSADPDDDPGYEDWIEDVERQHEFDEWEMEFFITEGRKPSDEEVKALYYGEGDNNDDER